MKAINRTQFTFYESYYLALVELPKEEQADVLMAVARYALYGETTELHGISNMAFQLIKPTLDNGRNKAEKRLNDPAEKRKKKSVSPSGQNKNDFCSSQWAKQNGNENEKEREREREKEREYKNENEGENEGENEKDSFIVNNPLVNIPVVNSYKANATNTNDNDPVLSEVVNAYTERLGNFLSSSSTSELVTLYHELGKDLMLRALNIALDNGKPTWAYIRAILRAYKNEGIKTVDEAIKREHEREQAKKKSADLKQGERIPPATQNKERFSPPPGTKAEDLLSKLK